jgi:flagellar motor switch protein FliN/FliY
MKLQDVIDIDKLAGEALDILINKRPFAEGEIVVVTNLMAVRITRLIDRTPPDEEDD